MRHTIYVETTIPSFYHEVRTEPEMVARRAWTRRWERVQERHELVSSVAVIRELESGDFPAREDCIALVSSLPLLAIEQAVLDVAAVYVSRHVMPSDPAGDAMHLALASHHRCQFLVTWNCKHLANANKFGHIRRVNMLLGLYVPTLVTPLELLEEESP